MCYNNDAAILQEEQLGEASNTIKTCFSILIENFESESYTNIQRFKLLQRQFSEQRIPEALCLLIELIYYKTTPPEYRDKPFKPDRLCSNRVFDSKTD